MLITAGFGLPFFLFSKKAVYLTTFDNALKN